MLVPRREHTMVCCAGLLLVVVLASCATADGPQAMPMTRATPTLAPNPTLAPTTVPGSPADKRTVTDTVWQFGRAVTRGDTVVALLVLSPSAQHIVAVSDLDAFLGTQEHPRLFTVHDVRLDGDVAVAECSAGTPNHEQTLRLQLVRLGGVWKVDARVNK